MYTASLCRGETFEFCMLGDLPISPRKALSCDLPVSPHITLSGLYTSITVYIGGYGGLAAGVGGAPACLRRSWRRGAWSVVAAALWLNFDRWLTAYWMTANWLVHWVILTVGFRGLSCLYIGVDAVLLASEVSGRSSTHPRIINTHRNIFGWRFIIMDARNFEGFECNSHTASRSFVFAEPFLLWLSTVIMPYYFALITLSLIVEFVVSYGNQCIKLQNIIVFKKILIK